MYTVHLEKKPRDALVAADTLTPIVNELVDRPLTAADVSARSGVPLDLCEPALIVIAARRPARLGVGPSGGLVFTFGRQAPDRAGPIARYWRASRSRWADAFAWVIALVLVLGIGTGLVAIDRAVDAPVLRVIGVLLIIGAGLPLAFAGLGLFLGGAGFVLGVASVVDDGLAGVPRLVLYAVLGLALAVAYLAMVGRFFRWTGGVGLFRSVRGLMLGPRSERSHGADALADERRVTALIRANAGIIATHDLALALGVDLEQADRMIARVMCDYGGDVLVTDDGAVLFRFDPMLETRGAVVTDRPEPAYTSPPPAPRFIAASPGFVLGAFIVAIIGLVVASARPDLPLLPGLGDLKRIGRNDLLEAAGATGAWVYLISIATLALRVPAHRRRRAAHAAHLGLLRHHALLHRAVAAEPRAVVVPMIGLDTRVLARLHGELEPVDDRAAKVTFPEAARAARAAERLREPVATA